MLRTTGGRDPDELVIGRRLTVAAADGVPVRLDHENRVGGVIHELMPGAAATAPRLGSASPTAEAAEPLWLRLTRPETLGFLLAVDAVAIGGSTWLWLRDPLASLAWLVTALLWTFALGLYRTRIVRAVLDDLPRIAIAAGASAAALLLLGDRAPLLPDDAEPLVGAAVAALALATGRAAAYGITRGARRAGHLRRRVLIMGAGTVGVRLANIIVKNPMYGLEAVGFLDRRPPVELPGARLDVPLVGSPEQLSETIRKHGVTRVIVAFGQDREAGLVEVLRTCDRLKVEIYYVPRLFEMHRTVRDVDTVHGIPVVRISRPAHRTFAWRIKRVVDVVVSGSALVLLAPVLISCALVIRMTEGPDILFRQQRVGLDGRPFRMLKFRTLRPESDEEADTRWSISGDDRVTGIGRFLRATSLDELPQLWNIFIGEMSLVGPRPERPHFVNEFSSHVPRYMSRHRVPAGLTGWAQVNGLRGDTSIEDRAVFDNYYIENWSLWTDVKILIRTLGQVVGRRGA